METLYLDNKSWKTIQKFIGILFFLVAFIYLIASKGELDIAGYIIVIGFPITGLAYITNNFGTSKAYLKINDSDLEIKWSSNLRKKIVPKDSIVNFTLDRNYLNINRVSDKTIKLALNYLESSQKSAVVKYLFDFAETHNIPFIRK